MGGSWDGNENKIIPGVYQRYRSDYGMQLTVSSRGTVAIPRAMSWGPMGAVQTIDSGARFAPFTGYDETNAKNRYLNEIFKGTNRTSPPTKVLLYRLRSDDAAAATATVAPLTVTATWPGVRGNDISIIITELTSPEGFFEVSTVVDGAVADRQTAARVEQLEANDWVKFTGTGSLKPTVGVQLAGGADGTVSSAAYSDFLAAIEPHRFDILIYDGTDSTVKDAMTRFIKRNFDDNGAQAQLVAAELNAPDSRFVINVTSGVTLDDGTTLTPQETTWWVGGAQAGAKYNEGLTGARYPGAVDVSPKLSRSELEAAIAAGEFVLTEDDGAVSIVADYNSLVTYTPDITEPYHLNRTMRVVCTTGNDIDRQFSTYYKGVEDNSAEGRRNLRSALVKYLMQIQSNRGIQNFTAEDVTVEPGLKKNAVRVDAKLDVIGSTDFIYVTWNIN